MVVAGRGPLQLGYFDHPPISWWMARAVAEATGSEAAWVVRLPFIVMFAGSTWLMTKLGSLLFTPRAGLWAAIALNLSPVFTLSTGGWVLPDGPLTFFLLAACVCLVKALPGRGWGWWVGAGLCAGLAMLSKYTAVLTLAGAVLYLVTQPQHRLWLARPQPYVAALVALFVFVPVIVWNLDNHWASLAFQGGRAAPAKLDVFAPFGTILAEALFVLPWIWAGQLWTGWNAWRHGPAVWRGWLLLCLAAPPILLFVVVSLWSRHVLPHWAAPGYLFLFPLLGGWIADHADRGNGALPRFAKWTAGILAFLAAIAVFLVWVNPASGIEQARDWTKLRGLLAARHLLGYPVAATSWSEAGKIGIGLGSTEPVYCLNVDAREFHFSSAPPHGTSVLIISARRSLDEVQAAYSNYFRTIEELPPLDLFEHVQLHLYLGHDQQGWP